MKDMHKDRIETAAASIQKVLDDPDKETAQLVKEAREQYDSKCTRFSYSGTSPTMCSRPVLEYVSRVLIQCTWLIFF